MDVPNTYFQVYTWDMIGSALADASAKVLELTVLLGYSDVVV